MADLNHIMVDLETLGTVPGCIGLSIGAVEFFPSEGRLGREFYTAIDHESSTAAFLREEQSTRDWWERQHPDARKVLEHAHSGKAPKLAAAMEAFNSFLLGMGGMRSIRLYGNGADFDNPILRVMWDAAGVDPFRSKAGFFGGRCYRTLKSLDELFGPAFAAHKISRGDGTHHHALDDAKAQALHLMEIVARVRNTIAVGGM